MFRHIKNRILFSYFVVLLSCFLAVLIITSIFLQKAYFSYALDDLKNDAGLFVDDFTKEAIVNKDLGLLKKILAKAEKNYTVEIFGLKNGVVGNSKGQVFVEKQNFNAEEFRIEPSRGYGYAIRDDGGIKTVYLVIPIVEKGERIGFARISTPLLSIVRAINRLRIYVLIIFLLGMIISIPVGIFLSRDISSPLLEMTKISREVISGNFTNRVPIKNRADEIGLLSDTFNEMIKKLDRIQKERKIMLGNISHELMTPITTIRGFVETLNEGRIKDRQMINECFEAIKNESDYLEQLIEELQFVFRADTLSLKYDFGPTDIKEIILEAEKTLTVKARQKAVDIYNDFLEELPAVRGDYKALRHVFLNILDNAVKYSFHGGKIFVSVRRKDRFLEVSVKDEGMGIAPEDRANIFKRFYRGTGEQIQRTKGIGLGLSIVKEILDAHRADIRCESRLGKGTEFVISLLIT